MNITLMSRGYMYIQMDKLAKRGAAMTQHDNPITLAEKRRSSNTASGLRRSLTTTTNLTEQSKS